MRWCVWEIAEEGLGTWFRDDDDDGDGWGGFFWA
jgi:hypothetical protein